MPFSDAHRHPLTGERMPNEDDATLVPRDEVTAMGDRTDLHVELGADEGRWDVGCHRPSVCSSTFPRRMSPAR